VYPIPSSESLIDTHVSVTNLVGLGAISKSSSLSELEVNECVALLATVHWGKSLEVANSIIKQRE
jgi:hypothetical protein